MMTNSMKSMDQTSYSSSKDPTSSKNNIQVLDQNQ
jgi:hypothetical protein